MKSGLSLMLAANFAANAQGPTLTKEQQAYRNIPGNEFQIMMTSRVETKGKMVTIDPDDMMPAIDPKTNKLTLIPRFRFMARINEQMPPVAGEITATQRQQLTGAEGDNTTDARSVGVMYYHLVQNHRIPQDQITRAMYNCFPARGIPAPGLATPSK